MFSTLKRRARISSLPVSHSDGKKSLVAKFSDLFAMANPPVEVDQPKDEIVESSHSLNAPEEERKTPVIGVLGVKGGVGATTVAINLATLACEHFNRTILVDTNMQQPDVALSLNLKPKFGLADLIERRGRIDEKVLDACCENIAFEDKVLRVVSPPLELAQSLSANVEPLPDCLDKVKDYSSLLVIDLKKELDKNLLSLLDCCDKIILVSEPTIASISGAKRWLSIFNDLEYSLDDVSILFNEADKKQRQLEAEALRALNLNTHWTLPNAAQMLEDASLEGVPCVLSQPKSQYARALNSTVNDVRNWFGFE